MIKHFCDKCAIQVEEDALICVRVSSESKERQSYGYNTTGYAEHFRISLCKQCTEGIGLPTAKYDTSITKDPIDVIKDLVVAYLGEIVADEVRNNMP